MLNSNIAIESVNKINEKKKELEEYWDQFVNSNQKPDNLREKVYQSWKRSQNHGVNPHQKQSSIKLSDDKLAELIYHSKVYNVSQPILKELEKQTRGTKHLLTLCDNKGTIIYLQGDDKILNTAGDMNFIQGADWSEKTAGSNAIGTCIVTQQPIQFFSYEHYCKGVHPWTCSAAPIKDPLTGEMLGVFDLTGPNNFVQPHSLGLAQSISFLIQQNFAKVSYAVRQHLQDYYNDFVKRRQSGATIVLDAMLNVTIADQKSLPLLQIENWQQLWLDPQLGQLKTTLLNSKEKELEVHLTSLQLKVYIQIITLETESVGFLLHFEKNQNSQSSNPDRQGIWGKLVGQSKAFKHVIQQAQIAAPTGVSLLVTGETGTGKERFAQAIHQASLRHRSPFLAVNCGAIPEELMSSELFGYEPGAFTGGHPKGKKGKFEEANGGTLFLDEIGEMPLDSQVHLLRVLQEKEIVRLGSSHRVPIDVRIIAATNKKQNDLIDQGHLRADLYFRINVVALKLPPLRERKEDIASLINQFVRKSAKNLDKPVPTIDEQVFNFLYSYPWPGNIRELENAAEYAVLFCNNNHITISSFPEFLGNREETQTEQEAIETLTPLEQEEKQKIIQLLWETGDNVSEVARKCEIARTTLYRKMKKYKL